jgi:hypothetical protein
MGARVSGDPPPGWLRVPDAAEVTIAFCVTDLYRKPVLAEVVACICLLVSNGVSCSPIDCLFTKEEPLSKTFGFVMVD